MKFGGLDKAIDQIKIITAKYSQIATEGNQTIAGTLIRFIGQIEYLFIEAAKIEYEYYIQKEKIKEEQKALREQLRQEALEKRLLEQQQKQVEKEEEKYRNEIEALKTSLINAEAAKVNILNLRIQELEKQLTEVDKKKEEITKLQHGKAGYVYVISNYGSFGDNVFKIGMTRRLEPQDRIDELGSASVPFPFDVHSFIFSDNAPELEYNIHKILNDKRMNKVNYRKEFFKVSLDELEKIVYDLQPTAEFNRTMLAEQYNQTLNIEKGIAKAFEGLSETLDSFEDDEAV
ncbi:MAG TPA: GIY-YIG nuclease family protein [Candidatus Coproplasma excrementigallinarum]|uniref:GIY-YIG nuclease family protein n=1 Tax=Candidatus Coproplasma excrementigallinarum TaxID=2840747 RepID=A0A9D1MII6_9FIRM|nr:GIY-YIG nuclease family protein [Candidatus Coproplasma excrementigallinarum]